MNKADTNRYSSRRRRQRQPLQWWLDLSMVWKAAMAAFVVTAVAVITTSGFLFHQSEILLLEAMGDQMSATVAAKVSELDEYFGEVRHDARLLAEMAPTQCYVSARQNGGVDPATGLGDEVWRRQVEQACAALVVDRHYLQVRLIGFADGGRELVRVDRDPADPAHAVSIHGADLQQKGSRSYVQAGRQLAAGEFHVSPINLNREHGRIQEPWQPTQRFVYQVRSAADGEPFGVVVINTDAEDVVSRLQFNGGFELSLTNIDGGYIYHPDPSRRWGFEFGRQEGLQYDHPTALRSVLGGERDLIWNDHDYDAHVGTVLTPSDNPASHVVLMLTAQRSTVLAKVAVLRAEISLIAVLVILVALGAIGLMIRSLTRPMARLTRQAAHAAETGDDVHFESVGNDEIGRLASAFIALTGKLQSRSAETRRYAAEVRELNESLEVQVEARTAQLLKVQAHLAREAQRQEALIKLLSLAGQATSQDVLLYDALVLLMQLDFLSIINQGAAFVVSGEPPELVLKAEHNLAEPLLNRCARVKFGHCLCGQAALSGELVHKADVDDDHHTTFPGLQPHGHYNVPIKDGDRVLGVLALYLQAGTRQQAEDVVFLMAAADVLAGALQRIEAEDVIAAGAAATRAALERETAARAELETAMADLALAKDDAEAANRAKSAFLANMSHEIRTPMTAILGYTELLEDPQASEEDRRGYLRTVRQNGDHLLTLINDILDLSKIESGKLEIETLPISLWEIVDGAVELMSGRAAAAKLELTVEYQYPLPETIDSDSVRLRQIMVNLIGNALKFTTEGGVKITVSEVPVESGSRIRLAVSDTGIGMTPAQAGRLFQPFTQADVTTTRKFGGTGLGLTISRRLARALGGDITVESVPGRGSTFTVEVDPGDLTDVPRLAQRPTLREGAAITSPESSPDEVTGGRILLAEDTLVNQRLAVRILTTAGYEVDTAVNGQEARDQALQAVVAGSPYDLILMDMLMPVLDGYEATRELRAAGYDRPIVALTANAMDSDRDKCLAAGCDDFATKPFNRRQLLATIAHWVSRVATPAG